MKKKSPRLSPLSKKAASNIFSKPATEKYPFVKPKLPEDYRGQPILDDALCIGCGLCTELCPKVFELRDDKAWVANPNACDTCDCQQAIDSCPVTAIALE